MKSFPWRRALHYVAAIGGTVVVTLFFRLKAPHANTTTIGFVYLLVVLVVSRFSDLTEAILASLAAGLQFDFFFLPPIGRITIQDPQNWVALLAFLATAIVASELAMSAKRRAIEAERRRLEVSHLYHLSRAVLLAEPHDTIAQIERALVSIYDLGDAWIELPERASRSVDDFAVRVPLRVGQRELGVLHLRGTGISSDGSEAMASVVAIALERVHVMEESSHLQAIRESEALKSALLDSVTHDVRTPLTSIKAAVTTLLSDPYVSEATRQELLSVVNEESDYLNQVLQNIVDMAQIESGGLRPTLQDQGLTHVIEDAILRSRVPGSRIRLELPAIAGTVRADGQLLSQAISQLLVNAAAYTPAETTIDISVREDMDSIFAEIRDHGPGISRQLIPHIFDKWYRDPSARRLRPEGLGMGLSIARGIVTAHKGRIEAESEPGCGCRFTIVLPRTLPQNDLRISADGHPNSDH